MLTPEQINEKWEGVIEADNVAPIGDNHVKKVTAKLLENQESHLAEQRAAMNEATPNNITGPVGKWDPVLISLVRRTAPLSMGMEMFGVQPMSGPTGLIFAMTTHRGDQSAADTANDAQYTQPSTTHSGDATVIGDAGDTPVATGDDPLAITYGVGVGLATATMEGYGDTDFGEMSMKIEKKSVTALSRGLKTSWSVEMAQDLKALHGLDADSELASIITSEVVAETDREMLRRAYLMAKVGKVGARSAVDATVCGDCNTQGVFDLDIDSNGRWSVERFKGLMFQIERECNAIAINTKRGKGNFIVTSSDVASALAMTGMLESNPTKFSGEILPATQTFMGLLNGKTKVYVDPFISANTVLVGYKGSNPYDAGAFYCPYVPYTLYRTVGEDDFQPRMGIKTRAGFTKNPFCGKGTAMSNDATFSDNEYFRLFEVTNLI